jgi:hypothetical protein
MVHVEEVVEPILHEVWSTEHTSVIDSQQAGRAWWSHCLVLSESTTLFRNDSGLSFGLFAHS